MKFKDLWTYKTKESLWQVLVVVGLSFLVSFIVIIAAGEDPFWVFYVLFQGAFGDFSNIIATLLQTTPILMAGLAACIGFKSGVFNIGVEGQFYLGGIVAAIIGFTWRGNDCWNFMDCYTNILSS